MKPSPYKHKRSLSSSFPRAFPRIRSWPAFAGRLLFHLSLALSAGFCLSCAFAVPLASQPFTLLLLSLASLVFLGRCAAKASGAIPIFNAFVVNAGTQENRIYGNDGDGNFSSDTAETGTMDNSTGVALGDLDGDGDFDAFVVNENQENRIYSNDGAGNFSSASAEMATMNYSYGVALGDLDGDGDLDAFVVNNAYTESRIYSNDGAGSFSSDTAEMGTMNYSSGVGLGDLDGDGDLDAFVVNNLHQENRIYSNDGAGNFTSDTAEMGTMNDSLGVALGDLDGDGDLDAFVVNGNLNPEENRIYSNDGEGNFSSEPAEMGTVYYSRGVALGDLDGDGDLDAFVVNSSNLYSLENRIYSNDGEGNFSSEPAEMGTVYRSFGVAPGGFGRRRRSRCLCREFWRRKPHLQKRRGREIYF